MKSLQVAFLPIVRSTFDVPFAEQMIDDARQSLVKAGFSLLEASQPIQNLDAAQQVARDFSSLNPDLVVVFQATFADSTMIVEIAQAIDAPIFLWAVPEPWTGGRLRLNSLCGINLAGHALTLRRIPYAYAYASPQDVQTVQKIFDLAQASSLSRRLKAARFGVIGEHPPGMDSCHLDESKLKEVLGVQIERIPLEDVFARARAIPQSTIEQTQTLLSAQLDNLDTLPQVSLKGTLSVYNALKEIVIERKLDGLAVRCWPEFFTEMGCAACGAMSMLSDGFGQISPIPCSCEADINGTITQFILQTLSDAPAFGTDMVGVEQETDQVALWHCGLAPMTMANPKVRAQGGLHSNRGLPLVMDFPLKPGEVTFARLSQATGTLRLVLGKGEMLGLPKPFSGTSGIMRLNLPAQRFLDLLMSEGLEHHISLVYGDYINALETFAELVAIPTLIMDRR